MKLAAAADDGQPAEDDVAWQADALLQMKTGHRLKLDDGRSLGDAWRDWAAQELATAKLDAVVGRRRHDLTAGRNRLEEAFTRAADSVTDGYGRFRYEADNGGPAKIADGVLRIDGGNPEGDQRLFITSQRLTGRDRWPDRLEVRARLGGTAGNNFGWHMGVSVGKVKVLFHPGLAGGAFRAETTDEHDYLFGNEAMSFEPVVGVMHQLQIRVTRKGDGAQFEATVTGGGGGKPHQKTFTVTAEQLGDYNRIGLERSGRTGGDALFDSITIRLGG